MALPTIIVDSGGGGSDTNNSGAGPGDGTTAGSAITSTTISTDGTGTTVTIPNANLTAVDTTGLHVVYINDTTAGHRRFARITGKANSGTPTASVTVSEAFALSLSGQTGGIGGKRLTVYGSGSAVLFDNNGSSGDAMPGWAVEMQSGHTESLTVQIQPRRAGDTTNGPIVLRGKSGAAVRPILTWTADVDGIIPRAEYQQYRGFEMRLTTGHTGHAFHLGANTGALVLYDIKADHATNTWNQFAYSNVAGITITLCSIQNCVSDGIGNGTSGHFSVTECWIKGNGGWGINLGTNSLFGIAIEGNVLDGNTLGGCTFNQQRADSLPQITFKHNTVINHPTGKHGLSIGGTADGLSGTLIDNNVFAANGGYGVSFTNLSAAGVQALGIQIRNNDFFGNTSGTTNVPAAEINSSTLDPSLSSPSTGHYTPTNASLQGTALQSPQA